MSFRIRKLLTLVEEFCVEEGRESAVPLKRVAALAVVSNPYADGAYHADLGEAVRWSAELGTLLGTRAVAALGGAAVERLRQGRHRRRGRRTGARQRLPDQQLR